MTHANRLASRALQADLGIYSTSKTTSVSWTYQPPLIFNHKNRGAWDNSGWKWPQEVSGATS